MIRKVTKPEVVAGYVARKGQSWISRSGRSWVMRFGMVLTWVLDGLSCIQNSNGVYARPRMKNIVTLHEGIL